MVDTTNGPCLIYIIWFKLCDFADSEAFLHAVLTYKILENV